MSRFQVLSLIGGGIRGAFITAFLERLEEKLGRPIAESFDLIAGTSTGAIVAAGLAAGMSAKELRDFYQYQGPNIFTPRPKYVSKGWLKFVYPLANYFFHKRTGNHLDSAFRSRFCPHALEDSFQEGFKNRTLGDITESRLIVPTVNLSKGEPHVFRSRHLPKGVYDQDVKIADVLIAATAAPTYFPHKQIKGEMHIDGGVWATDPSMLAVAEAIRIRNFMDCQICDQSIDTKDIHLLSIGTGRADYSLAPPGGDAGLIYWASRAAELMGTSQVQGIHLPLKFLLGNRYRHINFKMTELWDIADTTLIPDLFEIGDQRAEEKFDVLNEHFFSHTRTPYQPVDSTEHEVVVDEFGYE